MSRPVPSRLLSGALIGVLACAAALLAATAPVPRLETLARAGVADPERVLGPAIDEGILALDRGLVRFEHPLLAQAALASVDEATLRELHLVLARTASSEDTRAHHLGAAATEPDEEAAAALEQAASRARDRGASLDSVALYERASVLTPTPEPAAARALLAAEGAFIDLDPETGRAQAIRRLQQLWNG